MNSSDVAAAAFASWKFEPGIIAALLFTGIFYVRGWRRLQRSAPLRFPGWRLGCFLGGLATIFFALTSPLDAFANFLLTIHMVQHLLLTMVAPPLLLLGSPYLPILVGMPRRFTADVLGPFLVWTPLKAAGGFLTHPVVAWLLFAISNIAWHTPPLYELALRSSAWHRVEHACFLGTALLFWWNVILPWPSHQDRPRWIVIPYLLLADFQNTALAAFFSFYDAVLYPTYATAPRISDLTPLADQAGAGAIMWVPGSIAFLIPCGAVAVGFLSRKKRPIFPPPRGATPNVFLPEVLSSRFSKIRFRLSPRLLSRCRRVAQFTLLALAALIVVDGFTGPPVSAMNAAGTLPWTHWRGLTVLALVFAGNLFCMTCPFVLVRDMARRLFGQAHLPWPRILRNKWLPVALIALYLWAYEGFALWDRPWATAALVVGYFGAASLVDTLFKGASFCKYVCPIGQFHFVQSLASPAEVRIKEPDACRTCRTYDCIKGNATQRGCELQLFQPKKSGNMDCTFCLDCVTACPHDNVAIQTSLPGRDLWRAETRSSIGRWESRPDVAALILLLTFGAFANAAGMVVPVQALASTLGLSHLAFTTGFLLAALGMAIFTTAIATFFARPHERIRAPGLQVAAAYAVALAPLGFGMWLAHFVFHLFTASHTPIPVLQRLLGFAPNWAIASWNWPGLLGVELLFLDGGILLTLYTIWRISRNRSRRPLRAGIPWAILASALYVAGVWIIFQPMQMRGTLTP